MQGISHRLLVMKYWSRRVRKKMKQLIGGKGILLKSSFPLRKCCSSHVSFCGHCLPGDASPGGNKQGVGEEQRVQRIPSGPRGKSGHKAAAASLRSVCLPACLFPLRAE